MNIEELKEENLKAATDLAKNVMPFEGKFRFSVPYNGRSVMLVYDWEEVWHPVRLKEFRDRQQKITENNKAANERTIADKLDGADVEEPEGLSSEEIRKQVQARMGAPSGDNDGEVKPYGMGR